MTVVDHLYSKLPERMRLIQALTAGVLVATVAVLVTVLALLYTMPKPLQQHSCEKICLPSIPFTNGLHLRCGCSHDRFQEYLNEAIIKKEASIRNGEDIKSTTGPSPQLMGLLKSLPWNIKPSARVTGKKQPPHRPYDGDMIPLREWQEKDDRAFIRYGMEYRNGRLVVPVKGLYQIHSFLDLYETSSNTTSAAHSSHHRTETESASQAQNNGSHHKHTGIKHAIYRYNIINGTEEELIRTEHPREVSQNGYFSVYDSYLAAAVSLEPGDEVYVKLSDLKLLAHPHSNYFGVSMI